MDFILHYIRIDSGSITLLVLVIIGIIFAMQSKTERKGSDYKNISGEELNALMAINKDLKIVDVRSKGEYEENHIPNAINIPIDNLEETISKILPNKNELIVIYCQSGLRAKLALKTMKNLEYTKIYNLGAMNKYFDRVQ